MSWMLGGIVGALIAFAIPVLAIVLVARAGRGGTGIEAAPGAPLRRFFQYGLMLVALVLVASGLEGLGRAAFEGDALVRGAGRVALPLAQVVVGAPLFVALASWTRRRMGDDPGEQHSIGWLLYLTVALLVSLVVAMAALSDAISAVVGAGDAGEASWVRAVVWGAVWLGHWRASTLRVPADGSRSHRLLGSLVGLVSTVSFVIALGVIVLTWAYGELFLDPVATTVGDDLRSLAGPLAVSIAVFWWYWIRTSRRQDPVTVGWNAYVLLAGVLGGLLIGVVAATSAVFLVLLWLVGDVGAADAATHFEALPSVVFAGAVGAASWRYHRAVLHGVEAAPAEVVRAYRYLLAALGLAASAVGSTVLLAALIGVVTGPAPLDETGRNVAIFGFTVLLVGVPLWWTAWSSMRGPDRDEVEERTAASRRLYLSASFGIGGVVAVVALITAVARILEDLFDGSFGGDTIYDVRIGLALMLTIGTVAAYHWKVFREDRAAGPVGARVLDRVTVISGSDDLAIGRALAQRTGARVEMLLAPDAGSADVDDLAAVLDGVEGREGVVIVEGDGTVRAFAARRL